MLKPTLCVNVDLERLVFPVWAQVKEDGVRCIIDHDAGAVTREGKPIPNPYVRSALDAAGLWGCDGELTAPGGFEAAQSVFMGSAPPPPGWRFVAFDHAGAGVFPDRLARVRSRVGGLQGLPWLTVAETWRLTSQEALAACYARVLGEGAEGLMLRSGGWGYREGKASLHRGELLRLKPVDDCECRILSAHHRADDPESLGSVTVDWQGRALGLPAGVTHDQARALWSGRSALTGVLANVRHLGFTSSGLPRNAVFAGLRRDLN